MKNLKIVLKKYNVFFALMCGYQKILSPDHGIFKYAYGNSRCRFYPSCSEYALSYIRQYGLVFGIVAGFKRVAKCGPWHPGGYDPVK